MTENRQHHQNPAPISDSSVTGVVAPFPFNGNQNKTTNHHFY